MKRQRRQETKENDASLFPYQNLPQVIHNKIDDFYRYPVSYGIGLNKNTSTSNLQNKWKNKNTCPPNSMPADLRKKPIIGRDKLDQLFICNNHPLLEPSKIGGENDYPCCLPFRILGPDDWMNVFKFFENNIFKNPEYQISIYHDYSEIILPNRDKKNISNFIERIYSELIPKILNGDVNDMITISFNNITVAIYEFNTQDLIFEASYPNHWTNDYDLDKLMWDMASDNELEPVDFDAMGKLAKYRYYSLDDKMRNIEYLAQLYNRFNVQKYARDINKKYGR